MAGMISSIFHTLIYNPIYNALIFLVSVIPGGDVGIAIVILTIVVKLILFPLSLKAARTQLLMREVEPALQEIRKNYKDKEEQARKTLALYKERGVNPFATVLLSLIQIPIILGLYLVFYHEKLPSIDYGLLYSFLSEPDTVKLFFLGLVDVTKSNLILALFAGATQFLQVKLAMPVSPLKKSEGGGSFAEDFARSMQIQMQYVLPVIIFGVSFSVAAAIPLYFIVSNLFAIGQELYIRRNMKKPVSTQAETKQA